MPLGPMAAALKPDVLAQGGVLSRKLPCRSWRPSHSYSYSHPQLLLLQQDILRM